MTNDLSVVSSTPASNTSLALGDYDLVGTTALSDTLTNANMTDSAYNTLTLNSTGLSSISKSGITKFGLRNHTHDRANDDPSPWTDDLAQTYVNAYMADASGTTTDPKLVIVYGVEEEDPYTYPATTTLQDLRYTYDAVGNITQLLDLSGTRSYASTSYQYDNLYRLTRASSTNATTTNWLETYTYNDLGNLLTKSDIGSYTYAGTGFANPHAPTTINGVSYSYDNAGNLTAKGGQTFAWDAWNRLQESANAGTTTAYTYDHTGQRVTQSVNRGSGTTTTIYWSKLYQTEGSTTTLSIFLPDGTLLATVEGNGSATTTSIIHTDHLNSVALTSDKNGTLSELSAYYPYGAHRITDLPSSGTNVERGFIGQYEDGATSLSYLQARYYDGTRGQFLSVDSVFLRDPNRQNLANPQSFNSYAYANGNPVGLSDPSGEAGGPPGRQSFSSFNAWASASLSWAQSTLTVLQTQVQASRASSGGTSNSSSPSTPVLLQTGNAASTPMMSVGGGGGSYLTTPTPNTVTAAQINERYQRDIEWATDFGPGGLAKATGRSAPIIRGVIEETLSGKSTREMSKFELSSSEVLEAADQFLGTGYRTVNKERGIYRSEDGLRQFRMDSSSLLGAHSPNVPHVQFEVFESAQSTKPYITNHVPFYDF